MSIVNRSGASLLSALFAKAGKLSPEAVARALGVSPQSVRTWRETLENGNEIELRSHVREKILAYIEGRATTAPDVAELLAAHQRDLADLARDYTRRIVDAVSANIDKALAEPGPVAQPSASAKADASVAARIARKGPLVDTPEALALRQRSLAAVEAVRAAEAATPHRPEAATKPKRRPKAG